MALDDWNWRLAADRQDLPWDCAATSLGWALRSIGMNLSEQDVIAGLGSSRISPTWGLLDASGAGLVEYLAELGIVAENTPVASWRDMTSSAGFQPMVMGGRKWCHWTGVRMGPDAFQRPDLDYLELMNPSPGWMGVADWISQADFDRVGSFSAVWFVHW